MATISRGAPISQPHLVTPTKLTASNGSNSGKKQPITMKPAPSTTTTTTTTSSSSSSSDYNCAPVVVIDKRTNKRYLRGKFLGKGGFAKCYEMKDLDTNQILAGKIVSKATLTKHRAQEKLTTEIKIHQSLSHPYIVGFYSFFEDAENVYIILELCPNKSLMELHKRRKTLTEPEVRFYLKQLIEATQFMHKKRVIHRDLKLGNIFLGENLDVKVGDFGLATTVDDGERKRTLCGTPNYIAPEILDSKDGHSFEVDVWSMGCILYTLLVGRPPFETNSIKTTYRKIAMNDYKIPSSAMISEDAKSLIRNMLQRQPERRPSLEAILQHPFFTAHHIPSSLSLSTLNFPPSTDVSSQPSTSHPYTQPPLVSKFREPLKSVNAHIYAEDAKSRSPTLENQFNALKINNKVNEQPVRSMTMGAQGVNTFQHPGLNQKIALNAAGSPMVTIPTTTTTTTTTTPPSTGHGQIQSRPHGSTHQEVARPRHMSVNIHALSRQNENAPPSTVSAPVTTAPSSSGPLTAKDTIEPARCRAKSVSLSKEALLTTQKRLLEVLSKQSHATVNVAPAPVPTSQQQGLWISKWVDYSNKYGLGYQMSDGSVGVLFNDATKMVLSQDQQRVEFVERESEGGAITMLSLTEYPEHLAKKVTLLKYFRSYMDENLMSGVHANEGNSARHPGLVHVKKWLRTKHAIVFRLSDGVIQINFFDHTKLIVNVNADLLSVFDKDRNFTCYRLEEVAQTSHESVHDIISRLSYAADVVDHLITGALSKQP